jgi:hypothetical protein
LRFGHDAGGLEQNAAILILAKHKTLARMSGKYYATAIVGLDEDHEVLSVVPQV